jgi:hypothetical protein
LLQLEPRRQQDTADLLSLADENLRPHA